MSLVFILVAACVGAGFFFFHGSPDEQTLLRTRLSSAGVSATSTADTEALRLEYAREMLTRTPVLALPQTDLDSLEKSVAALGNAQQRLSSIQSSPKDAEAVSALYPLEYLRALSAAERARRAFLAEGGRESLERYFTAARAAADAYTEGVREFKERFSAVVTSDTFETATADALVGRAAMRAAADTLLSRGKDYAQRIDAQRRCVSGSVASCREDDLAWPIASAAAPQEAPGLSSRAREVRALFAGALGEPSLLSLPALRIASSTCLRGPQEDPVAVLRVLKDAQGSPLVTLPYPLGDIRLMRTDANSDDQFDRFLNAQGIVYFFSSPLVHYRCESFGAELSAFVGTDAVRAFAARSPLGAYAGGDAPVARTLEERLRGEVAQEADARAYLSLAGTLAAHGALPQGVRAEALSLARALKDGSAGFDLLVQFIARVEHTNLTIYEHAKAVGLGAARLYFGESGFPEFYFGDGSLFPKNDIPLDKQPFLFYSQLSGGRAQVAHDVGLYTRMHDEPEAYFSGATAAR